LPLSSICWEDEMPDFQLLREIPQDDFNQLLRLFGIRTRLWKDEPLTEDDERFWDRARSQVPGWAFFRRKTISADEQQVQDEAERATDQFFEVFFSDADELSISEKDGVQTYSATFKVTKEKATGQKRKSWWERIFRRRRLPENHD
jgi:hypothetical protein